MGNKPLLFGGGSPDTSGSEDLSGVQFINGTRPGNPQLVELAKSQGRSAAVSNASSAIRSFVIPVMERRSNTFRI